jgi:hypothetical protein
VSTSVLQPDPCGRPRAARKALTRHREERSDAAIQEFVGRLTAPGLLRRLTLLAMTTPVQPNGIRLQASTFSLYDRQRKTPSPDSASAIAIAAIRS